LVIIENVPLARDPRARRQVEALASHGYDVTVICRRDHRNRDYADSVGVTVHEFPAPPETGHKIGFFVEYGFALLASFVLSLRVAARGGLDAMQIGNPPDAQFLLALPFKPFGCSLIVDQRDLSPEVYADRYGTDEGLLFRLLHILERRAWRSADHVFTVNRSLVDTIVERGGISRSSVTVVGNGPHRNRVAHARPELKRGRQFLLMWLGKMGPQDHVDLALAAAQHIVQTLGRTDCQFAFIGDGEEQAALQRAAHEQGLDDFVTFTGFLEEPRYLEYLATADLALDSNLQQEVTPVKGMEYMSFGVPMVAFDLCETRRMGGESATYVEPGDAVALASSIVDLLDDSKRRATMGAIGRARIEDDLAWEHQRTRYLDVYDAMLRRAPRTARRRKRQLNRTIG
jgi:glycosyltransferase involved in cell wall biosynthesis